MNDTIIFLVLAGIALVFKWLTKQASSEKEEPTGPSPNEPAQRPPPPQSDEERVRRFLEALGAPPGTKPPPPVRPRQAVPRRVVTPTSPTTPRRVTKRKWEQPLPPLTSSPLPPPIVVEVPSPPAPSPPPPAPRMPVSLPLSPLIPAERTAPEPRLAPMASLGELLRRRGSVRQAVVLREVLGPPRGLQPRDEIF